MARFKCAGCGGYADPATAVWKDRLSKVCSEECLNSLLERRRSHRQQARNEVVPGGRRHAKDVPPDVRQAVLERDGGCCRWCGSPAVHVHHIRYRSGGGSHVESNLLALCEKHHSTVHGSKITWFPVLQQLQAYYYDEGRWLTVPEVYELMKGVPLAAAV